MESIVLLVEDERFNGGILNKAELMVAHALGNSVLGVWVGWANNGGPELFIGGVKGNNMLEWVYRPRLCLVGLSHHEGQHGFIDLWCCKLGGKKARWGGLRG